MGHILISDGVIIQQRRLRQIIGRNVRMGSSVARHSEIEFSDTLLSIQQEVILVLNHCQIFLWVYGA